MKSIKVSIIIPVYNAGEFLKPCVESLLNQTLTDCEFIFVDDQSTDDSKNILLNYQDKDKRIIIISQKNKGISAARNAGLEVANGEYIGFCDNDDYVKNDMFETLYFTAVRNNVQIVVSKTILGRDNKYIIKDAVFPPNLIYDDTFIQTHIMESLLKEEDLFVVWNKLYCRKLIEEKNLRFPNDREIEEDNIFNIQAFNQSKKVIFTDYSGYFYREVSNSESRKIIKNDYFDKALKKFELDYIKRFNLTIEHDKVSLLKTARFVNRVCYLFYKLALSSEKFNAKKNYIEDMLFNPSFQKAIKNINENIYFKKKWFELIIIKISKEKSKVAIYLLIILMPIIYHPIFSEFFRKLNNSYK